MAETAGRAWDRRATRWAATAALVAGIAVAAGAFGAHALADRVPAIRLATFETAARYALVHALALFALALAMRAWPALADRLHRAAGLLAAGVVLFSGSLSALVLLDVPSLGAVTPLGGACFLAGWALVAWTFWRA